METLSSFYADDLRRSSREIGFGNGWRSLNDEGFEYTVFWVEKTMELCSLRSPVRGLRLDGVISRFFLGIPPHTNPRALEDNEVSIEVLARANGEELSGLLAGWADHVEDADGYDWIRSSVSSLGTSA